MVLIPVGFSAKAPFSLTYVANGVSTTDNLTTITFAARALGAVPTSPDKRYIVVVVGASGDGLGTVGATSTINGVTAAILRKTEGSDNSCTIIYAEVPTGTTGDVVITETGGGDFNRCSIDVYRLSGAEAPAAANTAGDNTDTANALSAAGTITQGGGLVAGVHCDGGSLRTWTWTNATEDSDRVVESTMSSSAAMNDTSTGAVTVTATASGTINWGNLTIAWFRPKI